MQCLPRDRNAITPANAPNRGDPPTVESTGAAGKRAAEEGRTPEADVMHPTHGCCGRESPGFPPLFVGTKRLSIWH
ncbi:conserved hypothetical protein [Sphingomonas sp. EC-HK361]|jgi:hypothetical protein|nr:conserved hypothetical protein [Sphingomonas sp. EC-HK361]